MSENFNSLQSSQSDNRKFENRLDASDMLNGVVDRKLDNSEIINNTCSELLKKYELFIKAVKSDNEILARKLIDESRPLRSYLVKNRVVIEQTMQSQTHNHKLKVSLSTIRHIVEKEKLVLMWAKRIRQVDYKEDYLKNNDFCHAYVDANIPIVWDWYKDVVFLINCKEINLVKCLIERKQLRIIILDEKNFFKEENNITTDRVYFLKNLNKLGEAFSSYAKKPPENITIINCTEDKVKEGIEDRIYSKIKDIALATKQNNINSE